MPIAITCPSCKHSGRVPDAALGRKMKCPKCATPFLVEADGAAPVRTTIRTPPPKPADPELAPLPPQQQPLPSAFDLPAEPEPTPEPAPPEAPPPAPAETEPGDVPAPFPWFYGFIDTYTRVAMIAGIAVAALALIVHVGLLILALAATQGATPLMVITSIITAVIVFALTVLGILLGAALMFLLLDMAKNLREMRRTIQERSQQGQ